MAEATLAIGRVARAADVIYATGMYSRAASAARLVGVPLVVKLVNDPAYERLRNWGKFGRNLEDFQRERLGATARLFVWLRDCALRSASTIIVPSEYLRSIALGWNIPHERVCVIPNSVPDLNGLPSREELRHRLGLRGPTAVFVGRFVRQKNIPLAIAALARTSGVRLVLIGDGPERPHLLEAVQRLRVEDRATILRPLPRRQAIEWLRAADAVVLSSDWENLPHALIEALAVGTPVVATAVGGVGEIVQDGVTGLLVPRGDAHALARAMHAAVHREDLRRRASTGAATFASRYSTSAVFSSIAATLESAAQAAP
jgi:glycosyltransferase involved in cell wall biosynthesis